MKRRDFLSSLLIGAPLSAALAAAEEPPLRAATFEADVTPPLGAVLCHGSIEPAREIVSPLTARGLILFPGDKPIVVCAVDWVAISNAAHDAWRRALAEATETSIDRVAVHVVHQHDAPGVDFSTEPLLAEHGIGGAMFDEEFAHQAIQRAAQAARQAARNPSSVTHLGYGQGVVEKVASNRRLLGPDGKCRLTRMSSCRNAEAIAAPEGIVDPEVRLISLYSGERPLAVLTYYACHPQSFYGRGGVNWDFPGYARAARQAAVPDALHIHFNGAGGDIAAGKYNDGSPENRPILASRLEQGMRAAWQSMQRVPIAARDVRWCVQPVQLPVRDTITETDCLATLGDASRKLRERIFAARNLAWLRRMQSGHHIDLACLQLGPARVLHLPGELCIEYQLAAARMCPGDFLCAAAYGDLGPGYICTAIAYAQGGYETSFVSRVSPEVENTLTKAMRQLLEP